MTERERDETIKGIAYARYMLSKCTQCLGCEKCSDPYFAGDKNCRQFDDKEAD